MSETESAPESATVKLRYGVDVDGSKVAELRIRPPLARGSSDAQRGAGGPADMEIRLLANLCGVAPEAVERLQMVDYLRLQKAYEGFGLRRGARAGP